MTMEHLPPRNKSQRILERKQKAAEEDLKKKKMVVPLIKDAKVEDLCYGLNELTDTLDAFPQDIIGYFTLLKEIEAKCVYTVPYLQCYIRKFLTMRANHPKRSLLLSRIRDCIKELMPCLEEKMHVATIATDSVRKYRERLDQSYDIVINHEIPEVIRIGPVWEPCMKVSEPKTLQQQRSESRREAMAAKKARCGAVGYKNTYDEEFDTAEESAGPSTSSSKKPKSKKENKVNVSQGSNMNFSKGISNNGGNQGLSNNGSTNKKRRNGYNTDDNSNTNLQNLGFTSTTQTNKKSKTGKVKRESSRKENNNGYVGNGHVNSVSGSATATSKRNDDDFKNIANKKEKIPTSPINYEGEPVYCYCQQVSYGEMVGCDGANCEKEWFHLPCTGLKELPKGEWYCDECKAQI